MSGASLPRPVGDLRFGVHTPLQHTDPGALRAVWEHVEDARVPEGTAAFDWISVWDHFGALDGAPANLEAVAMHATLACHTTRVRCACLVYCVGYRSALQLASAIATIDHLSAGRAVLGLGAGYLAAEYRMAGRTMPGAAERAAVLGETADAVRRLLDGEEVTLDGRHVRLEAARCAPAPLQTHLPIVVGGGGERVTVPLAARVADGWNIPMATPTDVARKVAVLREHEARAGRPAGSVETSVNVGLCLDPRRLPERFGARWEALRPAVCTGSTDEVVDLVGRYRDAGVDRIILSLRAPFDAEVLDDLDAFASVVVPEFSRAPA